MGRRISLVLIALWLLLSLPFNLAALKQLIQTVFTDGSDFPNTLWVNSGLPADLVFAFFILCVAGLLIWLIKIGRTLTVTLLAGSCVLMLGYEYILTLESTYLAKNLRHLLSPPGMSSNTWDIERDLDSDNLYYLYSLLHPLLHLPLYPPDAVLLPIAQLVMGVIIILNLAFLRELTVHAWPLRRETFKKLGLE